MHDFDDPHHFDLPPPSESEPLDREGGVDTLFWVIERLKLLDSHLRSGEYAILGYSPTQVAFLESPAGTNLVREWLDTFASDLRQAHMMSEISVELQALDASRRFTLAMRGNEILRALDERLRIEMRASGLRP